MSQPDKPFRGEFEVSWWVALLFTVFFIVALAYAGVSRTLHDFLTYPLFFVVPGTAIFYFVGLAKWWRSGFERPAGEDIGLTVSAPFALYLVAAVYYAIGASLRDLFGWLQSPRLTRDEATAAVIAVTLILGSSLFYFRLRMRSVYGLTEAMIGVSIAAYRFAVDARAVTDPNFYIAMLTAGVYLVVRGFDNVHQGLTKDPKDPVASRVASFVNAVVPLKGKVSIMGTTRIARERSALGRIVTPRLRDAIFRASPELPPGESEAARGQNGRTGSQKLD